MPRSATLLRQSYGAFPLRTFLPSLIFDASGFSDISTVQGRLQKWPDGMNGTPLLDRGPHFMGMYTNTGTANEVRSLKREEISTIGHLTLLSNSKTLILTLDANPKG